MATIPRSQVLVQFVTSSANEARAFTVPDGYVVLVKSAYFHNQTSTPSGVNMRMYCGSPSFGLDIFAVSLAAQALANWQGWVVGNPHDSIWVLGGVAGIAIWISGAVLAGGPQFPPGSLRDALQVLPLPQPLPAE